jgi:hypothetical protein
VHEDVTPGRGSNSESGESLGTQSASWDRARVREVLRDAGRRLQEEIDRHPYRTMALVFGCGYVLGKGMPRTFLRLAGGTFTTLLAEAVVSEVAQRLLTGVSDHVSDPGEDAEGTETRTSWGTGTPTWARRDNGKGA